MRQRPGSWARGPPGMAEGKLEVLEKFFQPPWAWEQASSWSSASPSPASSGHLPQLGRGPVIGGRGPGERLRFSAFLDEVTQRVLSPAQLRALGWRGALDQRRHSPPPGSQLVFPEDQLSETQTQTQPESVEPRGGSLDTRSTGEDGDGDPKFDLEQVWEELMTLKEQFLRLQEDLASTRRAHQVLEEKLQSLVSRLASSPPGPPVFLLLNEAPSCSLDSSMPWASPELREGG
ncbi:uncharacterized protein LOC110195331 [Phascolarctos cinereus]|uniref:Uncharacterized protein LOC110195331 n=1 Tax=Phascolarctos cinereus TaxID=38626 RepID=A0A6P5IYN9_PHACI|nr:uncharacterized protein LOC110195331 [Phascolarctos cinereus]